MIIFGRQLGLRANPAVKAKVALVMNNNLHATAGLATAVSPNSAQRRFTSGIIVATL
jgi:hypothetical protein